MFVAMGILGLIIGQATSLGPTYLIATAATIIGIALFAAGSWHNGLLPRWLLAAWVAAWLVAGPLARGATPLLLAGVYILRRTPRPTESRHHSTNRYRLLAGNRTGRCPPRLSLSLSLSLS